MVKSANHAALHHAVFPHLSTAPSLYLSTPTSNMVNSDLPLMSDT